MLMALSSGGGDLAYLRSRGARGRIDLAQPDHVNRIDGPGLICVNPRSEVRIDAANVGRAGTAHERPIEPIRNRNGRMRK
jgi:hypothetical protein